MNEQRSGADPHVEYSVEQNREKLKQLMGELGYSEVETIEALDLTADQVKQLISVKPDRVNPMGTGFYKADRKDGTRVQALLQALPNRYVAADVFSPGLVGGHASNNDFNWEAELRPILEEAKNGLDRTKK